MSNKYKHGDVVPLDVICNRLDELAVAVTKGEKGLSREFCMRIPAELDHDADLVISEASIRLKALKAENEQTKFDWAEEVAHKNEAISGHLDSVSYWKKQSTRVVELKAENETLKTSNQFLKDQLKQQANFNPDWDILEITQECLRDSWRTKKALNAKLDTIKHIAEYPPVDREILKVINDPMPPLTAKRLKVMNKYTASALYKLIDILLGADTSEHRDDVDSHCHDPFDTEDRERLKDLQNVVFEIINNKEAEK